MFQRNEKALCSYFFPVKITYTDIGDSFSSGKNLTMATAATLLAEKFSENKFIFV